MVGISLHTTKEIKVEPIWNWSQHKYIHTFSFAPNMADNSSHSSIISLQYAHINGVSGEYDWIEPEPKLEPELESKLKPKYEPKPELQPKFVPKLQLEPELDPELS